MEGWGTEEWLVGTRKEEGKGDYGLNEGGWREGGIEEREGYMSGY